MTKKELRAIYLTKRNELSSADKYKLDDLILIQFQKLPLSNDLDMLMSFWPIVEKHEVNTHPIIDFLLFRNPGLQIAYPVTNHHDHTMKVLLETDDTEFVEKKHGILEPVRGVEIPANELDIVLIPLLAYDKKGYRVGYGKGFYDRFLARCKKDVIKIGLSYFEPADAVTDIDELDIKLSYCVTPETIHQF